MSHAGPSNTEAFLAFAHAQVEASGTECTPEELLARWHAALQNGTSSDTDSALEVLQQAGLLGCIESGVGDLSTNEAHMEGFGAS